jgi:hypothetical protein
MKGILITLAVILFAPLRADEARIAALEAKVAILEKQNLSLKAAIEKVGGKSLSEILLSQESRVPPPPAPTVSEPAAEEMVMGVSIAQAKARLLQLDERVEALTKAHELAYKAATDPRAPFSSSISKSKADAEKEADVRLEEIARLKAQTEALRRALAGK